MAKSRKNINIKNISNKTKNLLKTIGKTTKKTIPVVGKSLKTIGSTVSNVAIKSAPVVKKGAENVLGALQTGFNLGVKGVKSLANKSKSKSKKRRHH